MTCGRACWVWELVLPPTDSAARPMAEAVEDHQELPHRVELEDMAVPRQELATADQEDQEAELPSSQLDKSPTFQAVEGPPTSQPGTFHQPGTPIAVSKRMH